jgi:hypothetical protein
MDETTLSKINNSNSFIENKGQWNPEVQFLAKMNGINAWITKSGVVYDFNKIEDKFLKGHVVGLKYDGLNESCTNLTKEKLETYYNYFIGNDSTKWASFVPLYKEVIVKDAYQGIDIRYYFDTKTTEGQTLAGLRYDYIVSPGADISQIKMKFEGQNNLAINENGELVIGTSIGNVLNNKIYAYQPKALLSLAEGTKVDCRFILNYDGTATFKIDDYNHDLALIIDPMVYSTYLGGSGPDFPHGIVVDRNSNSYICGESDSKDFPTTVGAYQTNIDTSKGVIADYFVTKMNVNGTYPIFSTFIGGNDVEEGAGLAIDSNLNVYMTGTTWSDNYPLTNGALRQTRNGTEAFITKLNSTGSTLLFSTFLGGLNDDWGNSISVDIAGNSYITGGTLSSDFPTTSGAYRTTLRNSSDLFVVKCNSTGTSLIYSTFLGGELGVSLLNWLSVLSLTIDSFGCAYIAGYTSTTDYPTTTGAFQINYAGGSHDGFITKLNQTGTDALYSSYLGGSGTDQISGVVVDNNGNAFVTGSTASPNFPTTPGSFQPTQKKMNEAFITKFNNTGTSILYSSFVGGSKDDYGLSIALDSEKNPYITGYTISDDFPIIQCAYQTTPLTYYSDCFLFKLNFNDSKFSYSTFISGSYREYGTSICIDNKNDIYITGSTLSHDYPVTAGAFQTSLKGQHDGFVTKFSQIYLTPGISSNKNLRFKNLVCENSELDSIWVKNTGGCDLIISNSNPSGINFTDFSLISPALPIIIPYGDSAKFVISFKSSISGNKSANLNLINNSPKSPFSIALNAVKDSISFKLSGLRFNTLDFGIVCPNSVKDTIFNIENKSTIGTKFSFNDLKSPFSYVSGNPSSVQFNANETKAIKVRFTAPADTGTFTQFIDVYDSCGRNKVVVLVAKVIGPKIEAGKDTTICYGSSIFIGNLAKSGTPPYRYKWNPTEGIVDPDSAITLVSPEKTTKYILTVTDSAGCSKSDSLFVRIHQKINISAGPDIDICTNATIDLKGQLSGGVQPIQSILWTPSKGLDNPNSITPKLTLDTNGKFQYILCVIDNAGCSRCDTVEVNVLPAITIDISGDSLICDGINSKLKVMPPNDAYKYLWSNGSTASEIDIDKAGTYWVKVSINGSCEVYDTLVVQSYPKISPKLKLSRNPELCAGSKLNISTEDKYTAYNWSTGNTEDNITVNLPGNYYVEVTDINGCKAISDTVKVTLVDSLKPIVIISNNGILCPNGSLNLTTEYNYTSYLWNTGETTKSITITKPGKYSVHVKDDGGCEGTSEIIDIIQVAEPKPIISGDLFLCPGRTSILLVQNDFQSYLWNTAETTKSISISNPGIYSVTVTDTNGCEGTATTTITEFKPDVIQLTDIDFGTRKVNSTSKKNIELKNTNTQQIKINSIKIKGLEANTFTVNPTPVPPKTLAQNESINIEIDYLPTASKSYLDSLIIDITEPCIQTISIAFKGSASDSNKTQISTSVWIPDLSAKIGQLNFCIPLMAKKDDNEPYDDKVSYKAEITLDASVMNPTTIKGTIASGKRTIELTGDNIQLTENPTKIGEVCGQIFIGDRDITPIEIINFEWSDKDIINKTTNGSIKVSGICQPNIARIQLINPVEFTIAENPVIDELNIIFSKGFEIDERMNIRIYNVFGQNVMFVGAIHELPLRVDISSLPSGVYFVRIEDKVGKFVKL